MATIQSAQDAICYARLCVTMERYHIWANMFYSFTDVLILKYSCTLNPLMCAHIQNIGQTHGKSTPIYKYVYPNSFSIFLEKS